MRIYQHNPHRLSFEQAVLRARAWVPDDLGYYVVYAGESIAHDGDLFTFAEINAHRPALCEVLAHASMKSNSSGWVYQDVITSTMTLWSGAYIDFPREALGISMLGLKAAKVVDVTEGAQDGWCCLHLHRLKTVTTDTGLQYARATAFETRQVRCDWLNAQCPGWQERLLAVQALEMPVEENSLTVLPLRFVNQHCAMPASGQTDAQDTLERIDLVGSALYLTHDILTK